MRPPVWRAVLALALVVPGGLLILAGLAFVWAGLAPLMPWLRGLSTAHPEQVLADESAAVAPRGVSARPSATSEPAGPQPGEPRPRATEAAPYQLIVQREVEC